MVYSQSQRCNSFQIALSRTLQQFGISEKGLESLRNLGITAHPRTVKTQSRLSQFNNPGYTTVNYDMLKIQDGVSINKKLNYRTSLF